MKNCISNERVKATVIHIAFSLSIAIIISAVIFQLWFTAPLSNITGSTSLYWLIVTVDIICGPLLLFVIWNPKKPGRVLATDAAIVIVIQLAALGYGVWTIYQIRPVYIVFETDRLRMINATEIDSDDLEKAPDHWKNLPLLGPKLLSTRIPKDGPEMLRSIELSIAGKEPSVRPEMWEEYAPAKEKVRVASRSLPELLAVYPDKHAEITRLAEKFNVPYPSIIWLPLTSARSMDWVALIDARNMEPFTYIPGDGFIPR
ncbi:TfpX/TfpZ family type IV pilin accessory protein [Pantoea sp. 18069]|uniref:TfpX/TfpZ family type IV pilin accessory protein n=1 Tax=Pantoea sp. 18069 TaxID=2681415 RepID=UPI0013580A5B|nr:TfpX/TfpZ family type IV pilin accessory protein [Pantoea sp. 18069]